MLQWFVQMEVCFQTTASSNSPLILYCRAGHIAPFGWQWRRGRLRFTLELVINTDIDIATEMRLPESIM